MGKKIIPYVDMTEDQISSKQKIKINDYENMLLEVYEKSKGRTGAPKKEAFLAEVNNKKISLSKKYERDTNFNIVTLIEFGVVEEKDVKGKLHIKWIGDYPTILMAKQLIDFLKEKKERQKQKKSIKDEEVKYFDFENHVDALELFAKTNNISSLDDPAKFFTKQKVNWWGKFLSTIKVLEKEKVEAANEVVEELKDVVVEIQEVAQKNKKKETYTQEERRKNYEQMINYTSDTNKRIQAIEIKIEKILELLGEKEDKLKKKSKLSFTNGMY